MKNQALLFSCAILLAGCSSSDSEPAGDPLESAAYEEFVLSQVPQGDSKFDMSGSGSASSLGLPDQASCPQEVQPLDEEPVDGADATDTAIEPADGTDSTDASDTAIEPADGTDSTDASDAATEPADGTDSADASDAAAEPVDGTDNADGSDAAAEPVEESGTGEPSESEEEPVTGAPPEMTDPCADAVAETPWKEVYDLELGQVRFPDDLEAPAQYPRPTVANVGLGGTEFWQKWSGGENPTFNYSRGSDFGRRCMVAASLRFQLIMVDPPDSILELKANTNWGGSFFNWVDDFGGPNPWGSASGAKLWAWRTGLIKWISQAAADGTCYLPTWSQVEGLAEDCLARGEYSNGEIQGCRN